MLYMTNHNNSNHNISTTSTRTKSNNKTTESDYKNDYKIDYKSEYKNDYKNDYKNELSHQADNPNYFQINCLLQKISSNNTKDLESHNLSKYTFYSLLFRKQY